MAALNFPAGPTIGDYYSANGNTWKWDGVVWDVVPIKQKETKGVSVSHNFDITTFNYFTHTTVGTTALTVSNVPPSGTVGCFILELTNGGAYTFSFWSGIKWPAGVIPTLTAAGTDLLGFYTHDGGTTWRGLMLARDIK